MRRTKIKRTIWNLIYWLSKVVYYVSCTATLVGAVWMLWARPLDIDSLSLTWTGILFVLVSTGVGLVAEDKR